MVSFLRIHNTTAKLFISAAWPPRRVSHRDLCARAQKIVGKRRRRRWWQWRWRARDQVGERVCLIDVWLQVFPQDSLRLVQQRHLRKDRTSQPFQVSRRERDSGCTAYIKFHHGSYPRPVQCSLASMNSWFMLDSVSFVVYFGQVPRNFDFLLTEA